MFTVSFIYFIVDTKIVLLAMKLSACAHINTIPVDFLDGSDYFLAEFQ